MSFTLSMLSFAASSHPTRSAQLCMRLVQQSPAPRMPPVNTDCRSVHYISWSPPLYTTQLIGILSPFPRKVIPDFAIDNHLRVQKLDHYCKGLCIHLSNAQAETGAWNGTAEEEVNGESAALLRRLLLTVHDFVNFKEHCGQRKGPNPSMHEKDSNASGPLDWRASEHSQEQECSVLSSSRSETAAPDLSLPRASPLNDVECQLLVATESEAQKLIEDLSDADHRVRAHADTKRMLGRQVVAAQADITSLRDRVQLGTLQLLEAKNGAGASGSSTRKLCRLAHRLEHAACSLVRALEQEDALNGKRRPCPVPPTPPEHGARASNTSMRERHTQPVHTSPCRDADGSACSRGGRSSSGHEPERRGPDARAGSGRRKRPEHRAAHGHGSQGGSPPAGAAANDEASASVAVAHAISVIGSSVFPGWLRASAEASTQRARN